MIDTSLTKTVTFFVANIGSNAIVVNTEISPDGKEFVNDNAIIKVQGGETSKIIPYSFARYTRLSLKGEKDFCHSKAKVWCQAQV